MSRNRINIIVDGNYLDLYEDPKVVLNQKIQDVKDISKVFMDYTEEFMIPASKQNNKVFKHAFRKDSDDFDTRGFYNSVIELNGEEYNRGYVELISSEFKSGKTHSYTIRHYGSLLTLGRIIGDKKFTDIRGVYSKYNFPQDYRAFRDLLITAEDDELPNTNEDWWDGFSGPDVDQNVRIFLNNDTDQGFIFDTSTSFEEFDVNEAQTNIAYTAWTTGTEDPDEDWNGAKGVEYNGTVITRQKASLKETALLEGIEEAFGDTGLQFSRGLDSNGKPTSTKSDVVVGKEHFFGSEEYEKSWVLFYNRETGGATKERTLFFENDWDPGDLVDFPTGLEIYCNIPKRGYGNVYPPFSPYYKNKRNYSDYYLELNLTASDNTIPWTFELNVAGVKKVYTQSGSLIRNSDRRIYSSNGDYITVVGDKVLDGEDFGYSINCFRGEFTVRSEEPLTVTGTVNINKVWRRDVLFGTRVHQRQLSNSIDDISTDAANYTFDTNTPNVEIMKYFKGLGAIYNLMFYADRDSSGDQIIVAETANEYYNGEVINLTQSVDSQEYSVEKPEYFTEVDFKYEKSNTFQTGSFDDANATPYGDLRHEVRLENDFLVPSKVYEVEPPFEMILLNNPTDRNSSSNTPSVVFTYCWLVDRSYAATEIKAFRHYGSNEATALGSTGLLFKRQNQVALAEITACNLMSSYRYDENEDLVQTLLYSTNTEDPKKLNGSLESDPSLFNTYWKTTIVDLFDKFAKIHNFKARLSRKDLAKLKLYQNVVISDNPYRINELSINLLDGTANMQLISLNQPNVSASFRSVYDGGYNFNTIVINSFTASPGFAIFMDNEVTMKVVASGGNSDLTYAWYVNDEEVLGENESTYTFTPSDGDTVYAEVSDDMYSVDSVTGTFATVDDALVLDTIALDNNNVPSDGGVVTVTIEGGVSAAYRATLVSINPTDFVDDSVISDTEGTLGSDGADTFTVTLPQYDGDLLPSFRVRVTNTQVPSNVLTSATITQANDDLLITFNEDFIVTEDDDKIIINE